MSNQTKKKEELAALTEFLRLCTDPFAKRLKGCQNISEPNQERPDIVLADGDTLFGIECIHIPLCKEGNGDADMVQKAREHTTFKKYQIDEKNGVNKLEGHEHEALREIEFLTDKKLESFRRFQYEEYIDNCAQLVAKHDAHVYRKNIEDKYQEKKSHICFLLDITRSRIVKEFEYYHFRTHSKQRGVRKDYPFTNDFLNVLKSTEGVDMFLIIWHLEREFKYTDTRCYVLNMREDMKLQVPMVWWKFSLPEEFYRPWKVRLSLKKDK